jgi:hypothetical protein
MTFITRDYLDRFSSNLGGTKAQELRQRPFKLNESQKASYKKVIFLSHSHKDKDIVEKVALFLLSQGMFLYVDWQDSSIPPITSSETANKIKSRIITCDEFVVLASNNALDSKWVPWEMGFADAAKGTPKVFVLPVADNDGTWRGSEYFDLYQKIELGREEKKALMTEAVVRQPENTYVAHSLKYKFEQNSDAQIYKVR